MKRNPLLAIVSPALLVLAACSTPPPPKKAATPKSSPAQPAVPAASSYLRATLPGCEWRGSVDPKIRIFLLVQECKEAERRFSFLPYGNAIYQVPESAKGEIAKGKKIVEVFEKPPGQPVTDAIQEQFIAKLPPPMKDGCVVRSPAEAVKLADSTKETYEIIPGPAYKPASEADAHPCGEYGHSSEQAYFEYHPTESRIRFLFVNTGGDPQMFDPQSIRLR